MEIDRNYFIRQIFIALFVLVYSTFKVLSINNVELKKISIFVLIGLVVILLVLNMFLKENKIKVNEKFIKVNKWLINGYLVLIVLNSLFSKDLDVVLYSSVGLIVLSFLAIIYHGLITTRVIGKVNS